MTDARTLSLEVVRGWHRRVTPAGEPLGPVLPLPVVGRPTPLPPAPPASASPPEVLQRRTAVRRFGTQPVDLARLRAVLDAVDRGADPGPPLRTVVVALRVDGLPPGLYAPDAGGTVLLPAAPLPPGAAAELTLQRELAEAALLVAVLADLEDAALRAGGHGYRLVMTSAGAALYAGWLAGVAVGLEGTLFAGLIPSALRAALRCDGVRRQPLAALALGSCAPDGSAAAATEPAGPQGAVPSRSGRR